jgi:hypothetical protein
VGNTSGAVWNAIGAIVGGESTPSIGRLFKCLSVPTNIQGQGTVYDVEFTDTPVVSGSVSLESGNNVIGSVKIKDTNGDPIVTTAGNLMVGIGNIYTANPLHTIVDSGSVSVSSMPTTVSYRTTSAGNTGLVIKGSAGIVARIYISNYDTTNSAFLFVRLYDKATAPTDADTPLCCFDLPHRGNSGSDSRTMLDLDNLAFTNGLGIRATTGSNANNDVVVTGLASDITILYK